MNAPIKRVFKGLSDADRLMARVQFDPFGGCWLWDSAADKYGYGSLSIAKGKSDKAYRVAYRTFVGEIPKGRHICHKCDVPACINPAHLFVGTAKDNAADMVAKGRSSAGQKNGMSRLSAEDVLTARQARANGETVKAIAKRHGIHQSTMSRILSGKRWAHIFTS